MFEKSDKLAIILVLIVSIFITFLTHGCRKEKDIRRVSVENACRAILNYPEAPKRTQKIAKKVLEGWNNKVLDPEPVLIHPGCLHDPNCYKDYSVMVLLMSDEEFDIAGFGVREFHEGSDSNMIVIEEEYYIFPEHRIGHVQLIRFQERKTISQRKDNKDWQDYNNSGTNRLMIYRRREYPVVWISLPNPPTVKVEIWIFDYAGNKSEPVPFKYGLPDRPMKNRAEFLDGLARTGRGQLKIGNISRTCPPKAGTVFQLDKKEYAAGETGTIKVIYTADKSTEKAPAFLSGSKTPRLVYLENI
jgi:hypothetical protein